MALEEKVATRLRFIEPQSLAEAEERLLDIKENMRLIEAQLADRNRLTENGQRMTEREYHEWRSRAVFAKAAKTSEVARLKAWMVRYRTDADTRAAAGAEGLEVMHRLFVMCRVVNGEKVPWDAYDDSEQQTLERAKAMLRAAGVVDEPLGI
jgi:hypothetical protein